MDWLQCLIKKCLGKGSNRKIKSIGRMIFSGITISNWFIKQRRRGWVSK
jgi:hypothetical protein